MNITSNQLYDTATKHRIDYTNIRDLWRISNGHYAIALIDTSTARIVAFVEDLAEDLTDNGTKASNGEYDALKLTADILQTVHQDTKYGITATVIPALSVIPVDADDDEDTDDDGTDHEVDLYRDRLTGVA